MRDHKTYYFGFSTRNYFAEILENILRNRGADEITISAGAPKGDYGQTVDVFHGERFTLRDIPKIMEDIESEWKKTFVGFEISIVNITSSGVKIRYHNWMKANEMVGGN